MLRTLLRIDSVLIFVLAGASSAADTCQLNIFDNASKLILVSTADMRATAGTLQIFERPELSAGWKGAASPERVVVGYNGLGWAYPFRDKAINDEPLKFEGDKRTPAGIFQLGAAFGFSATDKSDYFQLKYSETFCVNDPRSPHYNKIVPRSVAGWRTSGEDMRSVDLYRRGLVINYPTNASQRGGSCIFLHVWRSTNSPTAGCVAMPEQIIVHLQAWAAKDKTVLLILPRAALSRFSGCLLTELLGTQPIQ